MRKIILILLIGVVSVGYAQDNLVPNYNFQEVTGKVKQAGAIKLAAPWTSPTLAQADLYVPKTKNMDVLIPSNTRGEEKPMKGDNYVGITAYSYKGKYPRSYLQVKLTEELEAGKKYCVTMHVSLSDISKYATSHIGIAVSDKELVANNSQVLQFNAQIVSRRSTIYEKQFYWTPICGSYTAKGGEQFITLGNFTPDDKVLTKKVKRPKGFTKPQTSDAYYYVDNISVVDAEEVKYCDCDSDPGMLNVETTSTEFESDGEPKIANLKIVNSDGSVSEKIDLKDNATSNSSEGIDGMVIGFKSKTSEIVGGDMGLLDQIVEYMKTNPADKITIIGYVDESEQDVAKLDGRRVSTVYKYLLSKGIDKERIEREIGGADMPLDEENVAKNMRVEIMLIQEEEEEEEEY